MCDVTMMTARINKLSRSGFDNRIKLATLNELANVAQFSQKIEKLVEDTYDVFEEIGEEEWNILQAPLEILIDTTKELLNAFKKCGNNRNEYEILKRRLSSLKELRNDITRFRLESPLKSKMQQLLNEM